MKRKSLSVNWRTSVGFVDYLGAMDRSFHLHLISDATGETLNAVAKAVCAQFEGFEAREYFYALVRSQPQLARAIEHVAARPGIVFFTMVNQSLRHHLEAECAKIGVPCISILDLAVSALGKFLGVEESHRPGGQHEVDSRYLERVEAVNYSIQHDDGQSLERLEQADVVLVGASRTSKTPTCVYLTIRGVRAANIPLVPGVEPPEQLLNLKRPLVVGLYAAPERLLQIRRNRLTTMGETRATDYVDLEAVRAEITETRRLFESMNWPALDVSRRSIEETAATVLNWLTERNPAE